MTDIAELYELAEELIYIMLNSTAVFVQNTDYSG